MRTEIEIKERLKLLNKKKKELTKLITGGSGIADWNLTQFETAIWYLEWVLGKEQ